MSAINLRELSDRSLISRLNALVRREHACLVDVLHHLNEVERRKLHRDFGYSSMFKYCTDRLGYSASAAARRLRTARVIRRYPRVLALLIHREVNLTTVDKVAGIAFERDDPSLFERIRGKTQDEVDAIAAAYRPKKRLRDRVETVYVTREQPLERPEVLLGEDSSPPAAVAGDDAGRAAEPVSTRGRADAGKQAGTGLVDSGTDASPGVRDHSRSGSAGTGASASVGETIDTGVVTGTNAPATVADERSRGERFVKRYKYRFTVGEDLKRSIDRVRALLSLRIPSNAPMEDVLGILVEEYLDRHCPERRHARREERKRRKQNAGATTTTAANRRHIPAAVRDQVMAQSRYRCSFVGVDGARCSETHRLQVDHIVPVALGGSNRPDNLRVLCATHNLLEAERLLGKELMDRYTAPDQPATIREAGARYAGKPPGCERQPNGDATAGKSPGCDETAGAYGDEMAGAYGDETVRKAVYSRRRE